MSQPHEVAILHATLEANRSPCCKSKRGVSVFQVMDSGEVNIYGVGFNGRPDKPCTGDDRCRAICNKVCVHAEMRAMRKASKAATSLGQPLYQLELVHVKVENHVLVPSKGPSCHECSREILDAGYKGIWLFLDTGWEFFHAHAFHAQTLLNCNIE